MNPAKSYLFKTILLLFVMSFGLSCKKENDIVPVKTPVKKVVLVLMEANNDLRYDAVNSINMMEKGAKDIDGTLLVYIKTSSVRSYLLKIKYDADENKIVSDTVKTFENSPSSDAEFLKDVIHYAQTEYPAESYGLILWSHATSWAPASTGIKTKSFGRDTGKEIDVIDLKNALPDNLEFLIFDACSMGGVEVLYEFRNKAKYIIASPAETLSESFPYQNITPLLFQGSEALQAIALGYYTYYNSYTDDRQSATVVLVKTSELQALATEMKSLMAKYKKYGDKLISDGVHRLDFTAGFPVANYDFGDFLDHNFNKPDLMAVNFQLSKTIIYKAATDKFLGQPITKFSGLTCYIPYANDSNLTYYSKLQWYVASGFNVPFTK
ncbi:clostripain-related cysteine peptidase [Pedobacter aquatilis]|uniref:clostripain-related cysteine peptidase n=1 Tax=Pedobacter aquatilis TaxID=351343 RepID=UPI0029301ED0|nr:clostripain-related cysteine peptidase [Pedobacter aquatilis]